MFITISQGSHSGALAVAEYVSRELELPILTRDVLVDASRNAGISVENMEEVVNRPYSIFERLVGDRETYLLFIRAALLERAVKDPFIYLGHAAHLVLEGIPDLIRVMVVAPMQRRIAAVMEQSDLGPDSARRYVERVDRQRSKWTRFLYDVDWMAPSTYDLVVNLENLSPAEGGNLVCSIARTERYQWNQEKQQLTEDLSLASRVVSEFTRNVRVRASALKVTARDGVVEIKTHAYTRDTVDDLCRIAGSIEGVLEVQAPIEPI